MGKKILVTGAAGFIGRAVAREFHKQGHWVRGFDCLDPVEGCSDFVQADITDRRAVEEAVADMNAVFHFAACPDDADFVGKLLAPNVVGLYEVCRAAAQAGTRRLVLASSVQVGFPWRVEKETIRPEDPPFINNHYSLTKVWAEQMGEFYARQHQLSVIAVRVGWVPREKENPQGKLSARFEDWKLDNFYLSLPDLQRFFTCCLESASPARGEYLVTYALSRQLRPPWIDQSGARETLGYEPRDRFPDNLEMHRENRP